MVGSLQSGFLMGLAGLQDFLSTFFCVFDAPTKIVLASLACLDVTTNNSDAVKRDSNGG